MCLHLALRQGESTECSLHTLFVYHRRTRLPAESTMAQILQLNLGRRAAPEREHREQVHLTEL